MKNTNRKALFALIAIGASASFNNPASAQIYSTFWSDADTTFEDNNFYDSSAPNCYSCFGCASSCDSPDWDRISPDEPFLPNQETQSNNK